MPAIEGSSGGTAAAALTPHQDSSSLGTQKGKLNGRSVESVNVEKEIPAKTKRHDKAFKKLSAFKSITLFSSSKKHLPKPRAEIMTQPSPEPSLGKPGISSEDHKAVLNARLVDKQATDLQIRTAQSKKPWKVLEKIAGSSGKKQISTKGFKRLMAELGRRDISRNQDMKLMVLFAAHKFETKQLTPAQMAQYMEVLQEKYVNARVEEQARASSLTLEPTGKERTGFGGEAPLKASEAVQYAELMVTTTDRLNATDATDKDSGVVHNYKRDFPVSGYGWDIDFEALSRSVDQKLLDTFPAKLQESLIREGGSSEASVKSTPELKQQLLEGVQRSLDEYADSLLNVAESRVSSPIKKDITVRDSESLMKEKLAKRRDQLVTVLEQQLGGEALPKARALPTAEMVTKKVDLWVQTKEIDKAEAKTQDDQKVVTELPEETLPRSSMLDDITKELAAKARDRVQARREDKDPEIFSAAAELLKTPPPIAPKPIRPSAPPPSSQQVDLKETAAGEVDHAHQASVKETIRKFEAMKKDDKNV